MRSTSLAASVDLLEQRRLLSAPVPTNVAAFIIYRQPPDMATNVGRVTWDDVVGEEGYRVEWSPTGAGGWQPLGADLAADVTVATHVLDAGQKLHYRVRSLQGGVPSEPSAVASPDTPVDHVVQVEAAATTSPAPRITLSWPSDPRAISYRVSRKLRHEQTWTVLTSPALPGTATGYADDAVAVGSAFEYRVERTVPGDPLPPPHYGYVYAGVMVAPVHDRGRVLLVVDETQAQPLAAELDRLREDLVGDGWGVERIDVPRDDDDVNVRRNVALVKSLIQEVHASDTAPLQSILILGHVPVPYSGILTAFDGHYDHNGAWAADAYYGEMDGVWQDRGIPENSNTVQEVNWARFPENNNFVGDGKLDEGQLPSDVEVPVGRVDFSRLGWAAPWSESELLRRYLDRDHAWRHGQISAQRRALVDNHLGVELGVENAWRGFAPLVGSGNVTSRDWLSTLSADSYLWSYGAGPGDFWSAGGVAWAGDLNQNQPYRGVFHMLFGTWFGDWDKHSALLREGLSSNGPALAVIWGGYPNWFVHPLGLGEPFAPTIRQTQNMHGDGAYQPAGTSTRGVHTAFMGDPTLRMDVAAPVPQLGAQLDAQSGVASLTWGAAPGAAGYFVYRADAPDGPYALLTPQPTTQTSFTDPQAGASWRSYMVRAVALQSGTSGSYFNLSQGKFASVGESAPGVTRARFNYFSSHRLTWQFSEDVSASLSLGDVVLRNRTTGATIPSSQLALDYHAPTRSATLRFTGFPGARLPDGRYRATLLATGITDPAGNPMAADYVLDFTARRGDANGDGTVNLADFNRLANYFGSVTLNAAQGDFNYDGRVNLQDFNLLASNFGVAPAAASFTGWTFDGDEDDADAAPIEMLFA